MICYLYNTRDKWELFAIRTTKNQVFFYTFYGTLVVTGAAAEKYIYIIIPL